MSSYGMNLSDEQVLNGKPFLRKRLAESVSWAKFFGISRIPVVMDGTKCSLRGMCTNYLVFGALEKIGETDGKNLSAEQLKIKKALTTKVTQVCDTSNYKLCETYKGAMK